MTTLEKLKEANLNDSDITFVIEMLEQWKSTPDIVISVLTVGMLDFKIAKLQDDLTTFAQILAEARDILGDTEDALHLDRLFLVIQSYNMITDRFSNEEVKVVN